VKRGLFVAAALSGFSLAASAQASAVIDQFSMPEAGPTGSASGTGLWGDLSNGQTFTAGLSGQLTRIDLAVIRSAFLGGQGGFALAVERLSGEQLFSTHVAFADAPISGPDFSEMLQVSLAGVSVRVVAGQKYKIVIEHDPGNPLGAGGWFYEFGGTNLSYSRGEALGIHPSLGEFVLDIDYGFRTYVDTAVPEPEIWALLTLGFGTVGAALRRRRILA